MKRKPDSKFNECSLDGCSRRRYAKDMCSPHYKRVIKYGDPQVDIPLREVYMSDTGICIVPGCGNKNHTKGYCSGHKSRINRTGNPQVHIPIKVNEVRAGCLVPKCSRKHHSHGLCSAHAASRNRFSITVEKLIELKSTPCQACGSTKNLQIDHNHRCCLGRDKPSCGTCVRGSLCGKCNKALGLIDDKIEILENMVKYLKNSQASANPISQTLNPNH
jgi:hypothetical protein